jgi:hypothetical protein
MRAAYALFIAVTLGSCQSTSSHSRAELARIFADPANRAPTSGNLYYDESQALHSASSRQLEKVYQQEAPTGE